ncbi:MAG: hypothetical protein ABSF18_00945 [Gammaproteobacteria bacterium]|jgi:opacity protein-like surface antigen
MKNFTLAALLTTLVSFNTYALPNALEDPYGFFVGGDVLASNFAAKTNVDYKEDPDFNKSLSQDTWYVTALARIGGYLTWGEDDIWFTAIDFFGEPNSAYLNVKEGNFLDMSTSSFEQQIEATYTLGGELKQGVFIDDNILGFLTAGLVYTQYKYTLVSFLHVNEEELLNSFVEDKFFVPGFRLGAGVEIFLFENIGLNLNTAYTWYKEKQIYTHLDLRGYATSTLHFDPSAFQIGAGVNIYLNPL